LRFPQAFPWDYKTSELGDYRFNFATAFIDFFAAIGWAYDLKSVDQKVIKSRMARTGEIRRSVERKKPFSYDLIIERSLISN
jgi:hypothetical protein